LADLAAARAHLIADATAKANEAERQVLTETRAATPVGLTGLLNETMRIEDAIAAGDLIVGAIEAPMPYAGFVDRGTRGPYIIRPTRATVLHWSDAGGEHFARQVVHPGIAARNYFSEPMAARWHAALSAAFS
jgi:hypothetical protein